MNSVELSLLTAFAVGLAIAVAATIVPAAESFAARILPAPGCSNIVWQPADLTCDAVEGKG